MNFLYILAEEAQAGGWNSQYTMFIVLGVLMVLMFVMSIVPQKKRQKEAQKMMDSLKVGTKIKTIGGFVGDIVSMDNTTGLIVIDLSPNGDKSACCTIDRSAIYTVMKAAEDGSIVAAKEETPKALDDVKDDTKI